MTEKERLLETDRQFAAMSLEQGAAEAFRYFLTENAMGMTHGQHPVIGRDKLYANMLVEGRNWGIFPVYAVLKDVQPRRITR